MKTIKMWLRILRFWFRERNVIRKLIASDVPLHHPKLDGAFHREDYALAHCWKCGEDKVVYAKGFTRCRDCGTILFSCDGCFECDYDACPYDTTFENHPKLTAKLLINDDISVYESERFLAIHRAEEEERWNKAIQSGELPF